MIERKLAKLRAEREGLGSPLPRERLEEAIPLVIQALDIIEGKRSFDRKEVIDLISRLEPYAKDRFIGRSMEDLIEYRGYNRESRPRFY